MCMNTKLERKNNTRKTELNEYTNSWHGKWRQSKLGYYENKCQTKKYILKT